jgi:hypothetical protein
MPANVDVVSEIKKFLQQTRHVGLILPTGWFGRPHDNLYRVTGIENKDDQLAISLSHPSILIFTGPVDVSHIHKFLVFTNFNDLTHKWESGGSGGVTQEKHFTSGSLSLVNPA